MPSFDAKWLRLLLMASFATASRPFRSARSMGVHHFTARGVGVRCAEQDVSWEFDAEADACRVDERCIYFVTGNAMKEREVNLILAAEDLSPFRVRHLPTPAAAHSCSAPIPACSLCLDEGATGRPPPCLSGAAR
jgi:hypothetical protein